MSKLLIVTTKEERSTELLMVPTYETDVEFYTEELLNRVTELTGYDLVYFRDPFTDKYDLTTIGAIVDNIRKLNPETYFIDNIASLEDFLIEDKWKQYELFKDLMPKTELVDDFSLLDFDKQFVKKKISARARGIIFSHDQINSSDAPEDYIAQEKINIVEEIRVITVKGEILNIGVKKTSKTDSTKVKVTDSVILTKDIKEIARCTMNLLPTLDLTGIDIARTDEGELILIEVNRSPQFLSSTKFTGENPFKLLVDKLLLAD